MGGCGHCGQAHPQGTARCPVTGKSLEPSFTHVNEDEVLVGSVVAERYHVREVLGQGTTGTVFAVEHLLTGRPAAMKVLRPRYVSTDVLLRVFHGEARAAWSIEHPGLAEVFDAGQLPDGSPFFATPLLEGETLAARIARERLSLGSAVDVAMQVLAALDALHARDLVVRDLRPQNIFLAHRRGCRPVVSILDLGLARLVPIERLQEEWDALRSVLGGSDAAGSLALPYYLSPERTRSEHGVGPASDLFVTASVFYEALTGVKPFVSTSFNGLLLQIAQAQPLPLTDFRPDVPAELDALVRRALSPLPAARPASAAAFQDELRAVFERSRRASRHAASVAPIGSTPPSTHPNAAATDRPPASHPSYSSIPILAGSSPPDAALLSPVIPPAPVVPEDAFEEQTRTDRRLRALLDDASATVIARSPLSTDEASAESPLRTVPPPRDGEVEIDVEVDLSEDTAKQRVRRVLEDEETATMKLTPEMRARIEAMTRAARDAATAPEPDTGPNTRRMK